MRKVAYGSSNKIMLIPSQNHRQSPNGSYQFGILSYFIKTNLLRRGKNIVGIFNQMVGRMLISHVFTSCHRMSPDKVVSHVKFCDFSVNFPLYTAYISENTTGADDLLQPWKTFDIVVHCGTQENIITEGKARVMLIAGNIHNSVKNRIL